MLSSCVLVALLAGCECEVACGPDLRFDRDRGICACPNGGEWRAEDRTCLLPDGAVVPFDDGGMGDGGMPCETQIFHRDADGDGFGNPAQTIGACDRPTGYVIDASDCDDECESCRPGGTEVCDAEERNEDCEGGANEGCACAGTGARACAGGTEEGECAAGTQSCVDGAWSDCVGAVGPVAEVCNGRDDDCDSAIDGPSASAACPAVSRSTARACSAGECIVSACAAGYDDCDGVYSNGCEESLTVSNAHCGSCRNQCGVGSVCEASTCVVLPRQQMQRHVDLPSGAPSAFFNDVAVDANGDIYVVGGFSQPLAIGSTLLTRTGIANGFLAKFSSAGAPLWAVQTGGTGADALGAVALDASGNPIVAGSEGAPISSDPYTENRVLVASFTAAGTLRWTQRFAAASAYYTGATDIAVAGDGTIYVIGTFGRSLTIGATTHTSSGTNDAFVIALAPGTGAMVRGRVLGASGGERASTLAVDGSSVYVAGNFTGTSSFGGPSRTAGGADGFVVALTSTLEHRWTTTFGGAQSDNVRGLVIHPSGSLFAAGAFDGSVAFGATNLVAIGQDAFVAMLSPTDGSFVRAARFGGSGTEQFTSIAIDGAGLLYGIAESSDAATFGGASLGALGGYSDVVMASYSVDLAHRWSARYGGAGWDTGAIAVSPEGLVTLAANFEGDASFGGAPLSATGRDAVVAIYRGR
ncbi:hypothetical protein [Sandaracinus amylolyticus]|nr:hypothetical protein [Sandaracinus amylolyticus]